MPRAAHDTKYGIAVPHDSQPPSPHPHFQFPHLHRLANASRRYIIVRWQDKEAVIRKLPTEALIGP
jgi:hypothetical protein